MKWLKVVWQWLNAPRPFPIVELNPPEEDGALRLERTANYENSTYSG